MFVCLGLVFATFLQSGMAGSVECSDDGQDFLARDYGTISVHLGKAHFIKIHPHSTMLILLLINMEQEIACLQPQLHIFAPWLNEQHSKR